MMILLRGSVISRRRHQRIARHAQGGARGLSLECDPRASCTAEPTRSVCAQRGPLRLSALATQRLHLGAVDLLRTDRRIVRNRALARATGDAQEALRRHDLAGTAVALHGQCRGSFNEGVLP